jgi:hypothetical protein
MIPAQNKNPEDKHEFNQSDCGGTAAVFYQYPGSRIIRATGYTQ